MDVDRLARSQHGVVSRHQALVVADPRLTRHTLAWLVESGRWQRVSPGVFQTHCGDLSWLARASAAVLHAGPGAALSLRAAAYLHGYEAKAPPVIQVAIPAWRRVRKVPGVRFTRRSRIEMVAKNSLPLTAAAQTVIDLADAPDADHRDAVAVAADAVHCGAVEVEELIRELAARARHRHRRPLQPALGVVAEGAESVLEVGFVTGVLDAHGLPPMRMQVPDSVDGASIRRDFEHEPSKVVVEVDGRIGHEGAGLVMDRRRDRRSARAGRITLRAGWVDVELEPCDLALDIHGTITARGWPVAIRSCGAQCPAARAGVA